MLLGFEKMKRLVKHGYGLGFSRLHCLCGNCILKELLVPAITPEVKIGPKVG